MSSYIESLNQATTASSGKSNAKSKDDAVMGKQDFLTLLVAQLKNQDPLSPDDPTEFTAQLAQFSSLEQLFTLNESMNTFVTSTANSQRLATLNTIGKEVAYSGSSFNFTGTPMGLGYKLDAQASSVTLELQQNGVTVATLQGKELSAGNHYITWNGLTKDGLKAPSGNYKIVFQAKAPEGKSVAGSPIIKSEVTGVDLGGTGGSTLITKAGEIAFNSIIGVFDNSKNSTSTLTGSTTTKDTVAEVTKTAEAIAEITQTAKDIL